MNLMQLDGRWLKWRLGVLLYNTQQEKRNLRKSQLQALEKN